MSEDLRCPNGILFGKLGDGVLEVKCRSSRCGASAGKVILHQFSSSTGELLDTKVYRDPHIKKKGSGAK